MINEIQGDGEFKCITDDVRPALVTIAPPNDHVPEIFNALYGQK